MLSDQNRLPVCLSLSVSFTDFFSFVFGNHYNTIIIQTDDCFIVVCPPGYHGDNCTDICSDNHFDYGCGQTCTCSPCHHIYGCNVTIHISTEIIHPTKKKSE